MEQETITEAPPAAEARPVPRLKGAEEAPQLSGKDAVAVAGSGRKLTPENANSALAWFMEDDLEDMSKVEKTVRLNVAPDGQAERWLDWTFRALNSDEIDAIRQRARGGNRAQRRQAVPGGDIDEFKAALGMVIAATTDPPLEQARQAKGALNQEQIVKHRFRHKPGLVLQLSGQIVDFSGYNDDDVREVEAVKNS